MLIQEVCAQTGLTKKAIYWYEKQGLINIKTDKNGYRNFTENDIEVLREIDLLRKLDLSAKEIKLVLISENKSKSLQKLRPKKAIELDKARQRLEAFDKLAADYSYDMIKELDKQIEIGSIAEKLKLAIPGIYGQIMLNHFMPYLQEPIISDEQQQAYVEIVEWLDNTNMKVPFFIGIVQKKMAKQNFQQIHNPDEGINKMLNANPKEIEEFKQTMKKSAISLNKWYVKFNPIFRSNNKLRKRLEKAGYYDTFIAKMKRLSPSYASYSHKLIEFDEKIRGELGLSYDKKGNIQLS